MRATDVQGIPSTVVTSAGVKVAARCESMPSSLRPRSLGVLTSMAARSVDWMPHSAAVDRCERYALGPQARTAASQRAFGASSAGGVVE